MKQSITHLEVQTLLSLMQAHAPTSQKLNPAMTWEGSHQVDPLFDDVRAVLSCRADKEVAR